MRFVVAATLCFLLTLGVAASRDDAPPPREPPGPAPAGMVWVPSGEFAMGDDDFEDAPVHRVSVNGFGMDKTEVTNEQFAEFVKATKYVTVAERKPDPKDFPNVDPKKLSGAFSIVFRQPRFKIKDVKRAENEFLWWHAVPGASWRHPEGPESTIKGREKHPAVHVCYEDALAYCHWAKKRLPTEAEWEFAARGGLSGKKYYWGDELTPKGKWMANVWQGEFPNEHKIEDGWAFTAPVGSFPPNGYGLYDMAGNVWEWCSDWYAPDYYAKSPKHDPRGPDADDLPKDEERRRVQRGGAFLCSENYCTHHGAGARGKGEPSSACNHTGFRCVKDAK
jgi:formylglycine-generating enzyme